MSRTTARLTRLEKGRKARQLPFVPKDDLFIRIEQIARFIQDGAPVPDHMAELTEAEFAEKMAPVLELAEKLKAREIVGADESGIIGSGDLPLDDPEAREIRPGKTSGIDSPNGRARGITEILDTALADAVEPPALVVVEQPAPMAEPVADVPAIVEPKAPAAPPIIRGW